MHRLVILAFALAMIGASPVGAVRGFCAGQPCCLPSEGATLEAPSCCNQVSCDQRDDDQAQTAKQQKNAGVISVATAPVAVMPQPISPTLETIAVRSISERLATLSTLLI